MVIVLCGNEQWLLYYVAMTNEQWLLYYVLFKKEQWLLYYVLFKKRTIVIGLCSNNQRREAAKKFVLISEQKAVVNVSISHQIYSSGVGGWGSFIDVALDAFSPSCWLIYKASSSTVDGLAPATVSAPSTAPPSPPPPPPAASAAAALAEAAEGARGIGLRPLKSLTTHEANRFRPIGGEGGGGGGGIGRFLNQIQADGARSIERTNERRNYVTGNSRRFINQPHWG